MGIFGNLYEKVKDLYDSRKRNVDSLREEIESKDLEIGRQSGLLVRYESEKSDLASDLFESEERAKYLGIRVGDLEKNLALQIRSAGHLKMGKRTSERRFSASKDFSLDMINRLVEEGYHPLEGERNGRYAFIDRHGVMTSFSKKAQKIFGYEPGKAKYDDVVPKEAISDLLNIKEESVFERLPVRISEKEIILKNVRIKPIYFEDVFAGTLIDFEGIARVGKFREIFLERRKRKKLYEKMKQDEQTAETKKSVRDFLEDFHKKFGYESA